MAGNDCDHCASQLRFQSLLRSYGRRVLSAAKTNEVFHQSCSNCPSSKLYDETLCSFCRHLRFRHLVTCAVEGCSIACFPLKKIMTQDGKPGGCSLCRILKSIILKHSQNAVYFSPGESTYEIVLGIKTLRQGDSFRMGSLWKFSQVGDNMRCDFSERINISDIGNGMPQSSV